MAITATAQRRHTNALQVSAPVGVNATSMVLDSLGHEHVAIVKGVGPDWTARLGVVGISSVAALARLGDVELAAVIATTTSRYPLELRTVVRLLEVPMPTLSPPRGGPNLYVLAGRPPANLREALGDWISEEGAITLADLLGRLYTAFNSRWLERHTLHELLLAS